MEDRKDTCTFQELSIMEFIIISKKGEQYYVEAKKQIKILFFFFIADSFCNFF